MNLSKNASCRQPFKELYILPVPSQYILSVLLFLTKNKDQFMTNSQMHKITMWHTFDLYIPAANLTIYQKVVYCQESRFTTIYQIILKTYLVIKIDLN